MYACNNVCIHACTYVCMHSCIHVYLFECCKRHVRNVFMKCVYMYICEYECNVCIYVRVCMYMSVCVCVCVCASCRYQSFNE